MSKNPYIRQIPTQCTYQQCNGLMVRDLDNKYVCMSCGRPYDWERKNKKQKEER